MRHVTVEGILEMHPCVDYSRDNGARVRELWAGRSSLTATEIAALGIPATDRAWALVRLISVRMRVAWSCDCAERVLPIWERRYPNDRRPHEAIRVARAWIRGEATILEVRAAAAAAYAAAAAAYAAADDAYAAADASAYAAYAAATTAYATTAAAYAAYGDADADAAYATDSVSAAYAAYAAADASATAYATTAAAYADAARSRSWGWALTRLVEYVDGRLP